MKPTDFTRAVARICHEVNMAYCASLGDFSHDHWEQTDKEIQFSAFKGVEFILANPAAGPDASHAEWMTFKVANGWKHGPVKDLGKKEHPCIVPYAELPQEQRSKDFIFRAIVRSIAQEQAT